MADNNAMRLGLMAVVGFLFIEVGLTGRLGSLLAAVIDPNSMEEVNLNGGSGGTNGVDTGLIGGLPTSGTLTPKQIGEYAIKAGFTTGLQMAIAIALAESGGNTRAHNPGNAKAKDIEDSYGLWQINVLAHPSYSPSSLYQPAYNAAAAFTISSGGTNWYPWGTYTSGEYLQYMAQAQQGAFEAAAANIGVNVN